MTLFKDYSLVDNLAVWILSAGFDRGLFEVFVGGTLVKSIDEIKNGDLVEIFPTLESHMDKREAVSEPWPLSFFALKSTEGYDSEEEDMSSDDSC